MAKLKGVGICKKHKVYVDMCAPCLKADGAARALRALARWLGERDIGSVATEAFRHAALEALRRARKAEGKR